MHYTIRQRWSKGIKAEIFGQWCNTLQDVIDFPAQKQDILFKLNARQRYQQHYRSCFILQEHEMEHTRWYM